MATATIDHANDTEHGAGEEHSSEPEVFFDTIFRAARECQSAFYSITSSDSDNPNVMLRVQTLFQKQSRTNGRPLITLDDVRDDYEQFRVWAKNLGVFAPGHASLDYRLRDTNDLRNGFVSLLESLNTELTNCFQLLEADRPHLPDDNQDKSGDYASDSDDSTQSESSRISLTGRTAYELQFRLRHVSDIVDKLIRLAELIRASGSRSKVTKATTFVHYQDGVNMTEEFETQYLPLVLKHRFKLEEPLLGRLTKAVSIRRRRFMFQAQHQKCLAYGGELSRPLASSPAPAVPLTVAANISTEHQPVLQRKMIQVSSILSTPTQATTFQNLPMKVQAPSRIVSASSRASTSFVDIPPPPSLSERATHAQCPYCCVLVPREKLSPKRWKNHIIADLQPYMCLELDCIDPDILLETEEDWIEHQRWEHGMEWWCEGNGRTHTPSCFGTANEYAEHLNAAHTLDESLSIEKLVATAGRPSLNPFSCCPFCDYLPQAPLAFNSDSDPLATNTRNQKELQRHIANELLTMFLIALPERKDLQESGTDTDAAPDRRTSARALSDVSLSFSERAQEERSMDDSTPLLQSTTTPSQQVVPLCDASFGDALWRDVWASPALEGCVREAYQGLEHDDILKPFIPRVKHVAQPPPAVTDYEVGWISTLSLGHSLAYELLDEIYDLPSDDIKNWGKDHGLHYTCGRVGQHNVAAVGNAWADFHEGGLPPSLLINDLRRDFPAIRLLLIVDVIDMGFDTEHLPGDVVVAIPETSFAVEMEGAVAGLMSLQPNLAYRAQQSLRSGYGNEQNLAELYPDLPQPSQTSATTESQGPPNHSGLDAGNASGRSAVIHRNVGGALCFNHVIFGLPLGLLYVSIHGVTGRGYSDSRRWQNHAIAAAATVTRDFLLELPIAFASTQSAVFERRRYLLTSLAFPRMDDCFHSIPEPYTGTSRWLFKTSWYDQWLHQQSFRGEEFKKVLWLCGSPGSGKSVLTKSTAQHTEASLNEAVVISFFFNEQGEELQRSLLGMYRSLLSQLLHKLPHLQEALDSPDIMRLGTLLPTWDLVTLEYVFRLAISKLNGRKLVCFVDALDHCDEYKTVCIASRLRDPGSFVSSTSLRNHQCYLCLSVRAADTNMQGVDIVIDLNFTRAHHNDIIRYLQNELTGVVPGIDLMSVSGSMSLLSQRSFWWAQGVAIFLKDPFGYCAPQYFYKVLLDPPHTVQSLFNNLVSYASQGALKAVEFLLYRRCVDVNVYLGSGETPLLSAINTGNVKMAELLLTQKDVRLGQQGIPSRVPLLAAIEQDQVAIVRCLLAHEAINVNVYGQSRQSPLFYAITKHSHEMVQLLVENKDVNINYQDGSNRTPLIWAVLRSNMEAVTLILQHPVLMVNQQDHGGYTALLHSIQQDLVEAIHSLLRQPSLNVNTRTDSGRTALHIAVCLGHELSVTALLTHPMIELNTVDGLGGTPLVDAIRQRRCGITSLLLTHPCIDVNLEAEADYYILSPLYAARNHNDIGLVRTLLNRSDLRLDAGSGLITILRSFGGVRKGVDEMIWAEYCRRHASARTSATQ